MANIYGKLKAVTADGVLADAEQIEETATGKSVAVALNDLRRAVQGQIDPSVINVDAYTKKETDGKIDTLRQKLDGITSLKYSLVDELPTEGESGVIYLVDNDGDEEENVYNEYIWLKDSSKFEKIGSTDIDIDKYSTTEEIDAKLAAYAKSADVDTKLKAYAKSADVDTKLADYAKTADTDTKLSKKQDTLTAGEGIKIDTATIKADILPLGSVGDTTETSAMGIINSVINGSYVPMSDIKGIGVDDGTHELD